MRITTLNLQGFTNWEIRKPEILAYLKATDPDVILFQEVIFIPDISTYNQVQLLNQELHYPFEHTAVTRLQPSHEHVTFREGLGMLSKFPVTKSDTVVLKKVVTDEHHRIIQLVDVVINDQIVLLANVHFSLTDITDFATAHLEETLQIIGGRGEQRIIAGDFNIDNLETVSRLWSERYVASTQVSYISYPALHKRNDYILVPKPLQFTEITTSGDTLSDHRAVTVNIAILDR